MTGLNEAGAAMFAGALAATYHAHIYGGYQAMYAPALATAALPAPATEAMDTSKQSGYTAPPLPEEEPPPPPPGVDDPLPPIHPPPPPPPDDSDPPVPTCEPPPLPPGTEPSEQTTDSSNSEKKTDGPVVIQAAAAIIKRPAATEAPQEPSTAQEVKVSSHGWMQQQLSL